MALEEYRTVREEEMLAMRSSVTTLRYGMTGCALLIGVAVQQHADRYLGWAIALGLVPPIVLLAAVIWMGEHERMARAGHYVAGLEARIGQALAHTDWPPLHFATWLREGGIGRSRIAGGLHRYLVIVGVFVSMQLVAGGFGLHFYWHRHATDDSHRWVIPTAVVFDLVFLVALLIYFRSSYERLRLYADELNAAQPEVRRRIRIRLRLYGLFALVGFVSAPLFLGPLSVAAVVWLPVPWYAAAGLVFLWMLIVPLVAHRELMHDLYKGRIAPARKPHEADRGVLDREDLALPLTEAERSQLRVVDVNGLNAPAMGRRGVTVTTMALNDPTTLSGVVAHETAHHRLGHLHPNRLSYLYLFPYLYYDDAVRRRQERARCAGGNGRLQLALLRTLRLAWTVAALPGWLAWVMLRLGWRGAEYDADRYARVAGEQLPQLERALEQHAADQQRWRHASRRDQARGILTALGNRVAQGRSLGYLPVPNEHPSAQRRLERLRR